MNDWLFIGFDLLDMVYELMFFYRPVFYLAVFIQIWVLRIQLVFEFDFLLLYPISYFQFSSLLALKFCLDIHYLIGKLLQFLPWGIIEDFLRF